jgi:hypothetical protein
MRKTHPGVNSLVSFLLVGILLIGAVSTTVGLVLWSEKEYGPTSRFYTIPVHFIPSSGYFWTWGMEGNAGTEPDAWHFYVVFAGNETAVVELLWNTNQSVLYSKTSAKLTDTFDVELPRTDQSWKWDWVIKNPNRLMLWVENFTIVHYSVKYAERQKGLTFICLGLAAILAGAVAEVCVWRRRSQQRSENSCLPS